MARGQSDYADVHTDAPGRSIIRRAMARQLRSTGRLDGRRQAPPPAAAEFSGNVGESLRTDGEHGGDDGDKSRKLQASILKLQRSSKLQASRTNGWLLGFGNLSRSERDGGWSLRFGAFGT